MTPPLQQCQPLRVGLLGFGVVGSGTQAVLADNRATITARAGCAIDLAMVATRTPARARAAREQGAVVLDDPMQVVRHPDIDVVVETMGGTGVARDCVLAAIAHGKHVVTANKALLALHGEQIFAAARARGVSVCFEGAVAVSIPIVKALREGLAGNEIEWLAGIVNGTSNFVLTQMRDQGRGYAQALGEAQALGYAEADPALDVDGGDAAHKLSLLAAMAFGGAPRFHDVHVEGIRALQAADFAHAAQLGHTIKLLAVARRQGEQLQLRVHPALVPADTLLARVDGSMNGILVKGNAAGATLYCGAGAGSRETASAVVADLVDIARALRCGGSPASVPALGFHHEAQPPRAMEPLQALRLRQYLRVPLTQAGSADDALQVLAAHGIAPDRQTQTPEALALLTQETEEWRMAAAVSELARRPGAGGTGREPVRLRVEALA
ncbi:MAG: homoserine dehydrogenase [Ramlibacter sp.]|nr:homoserine dehydrogenase [Ramlibacter sp.]